MMRTAGSVDARHEISDDRREPLGPRDDADVTRALEALAGQTIEKIAVTAAPGRHVIAINTDRANLTLSVDRGGISVDRVEVGG